MPTPTHTFPTFIILIGIKTAQNLIYEQNINLALQVGNLSYFHEKK